MSLRRLGLVCCVLALNTLSACGDDDGASEDDGGGGSGRGGASGRGGSGGGSAGSGTSGAELPGTLDRDTPLDDLAADDVEDLCAALDAEISASISEDDAKRLSCTLLAFLTSAQAGQGGAASVDRAECEQAVQDCLDADLGDPETETTCEPSRVEDAAEGCSVTVGEYFDCLSGGVAQLEDALDGFTCEALASGDLSGNLDPMDLSMVPECMVIETECPALLDGAGGNTPPPAEDGCDDTCEDANDGFCDDGGDDSDFGFCGLGTDCADCGPR